MDLGPGGGEPSSPPRPEIGFYSWLVFAELGEP